MKIISFGIVILLLSVLVTSYHHGSYYNTKIQHDDPATVPMPQGMTYSHNTYHHPSRNDHGHHGHHGNHGHHGHHGHHHHQHHHADHHSQPMYKFDYGVKDAKTGDNKDQWEKRHGHNVVGAYSLDEPDGTKRVVEYTADNHNGFNAVVKKFGHPIPAKQGKPSHHHHHVHHHAHSGANPGHYPASSYANVVQHF